MARGEGIKSLSSLFDAYKKRFKAPQASVVQCFIEVVDEVVGIQLPTEKVTYKTYDRTIILTVSSVLKQEVLLHQEELLAHVKARLGSENSPKAIR